MQFPWLLLYTLRKKLNPGLTIKSAHRLYDKSISLYQFVEWNSESSVAELNAPLGTEGFVLR